MSEVNKPSWCDANGSLKDLQPDSSLPDLPMHPAAVELSKWLTELTGEEAAQLKESIKRTDIQVPILVTEDQRAIIDGRNRYRAAQELGLKVKDVPLEMYHGKEEEIPGVILSRNALRRHLTKDQRDALLAKVLAPPIEQAAKKRQQAAGGDKRSTAYHQNHEGLSKDKTVHENDDKRSGTVADQLSAQMKISRRRAEQLEKVRKAGTLKDVEGGKKTLREAAAEAPKKERKTQKKPIGDRVWTEYKRLLAKFTHPEHREVKRHLHKYLAGRDPEKQNGGQR